MEKNLPSETPGSFHQAKAINQENLQCQTRCVLKKMPALKAQKELPFDFWFWLQTN